MREISKDELKEILKKHRLWLEDENGGERANLSEADLSGANLWGADLSRADLSGANLRGANLSEAHLSEAHLSRANLWGADLSEANLSEANLWGANLSEAHLSRANLWGADLSEANLWGANLSGAKNIPFVPYACPDVGSFIGYKKVENYIVELEILSDARRCSATGRKCRCDKAKVLAIQNIDGKTADVKSVASDYNHEFVYKVGEIVEEPNFNDNRWDECSEGIHFFINRQEAVDYR